MASIPELEEVQDKGTLPYPSRLISIRGLASNWVESNYVLLAHSSIRENKEFWFSVSDKDVAYLLGLSKEAQRKELVELAYHSRRASHDLAFGVVGWENALLYDHLYQEMHKLKE